VREGAGSDAAEGAEVAEVGEAGCDAAVGGEAGCDAAVVEVGFAAGRREETDGLSADAGTDD